MSSLFHGGRHDGEAAATEEDVEEIVSQATKHERERVKEIIGKRRQKALSVLKQVESEHGIGGPMDSEWKGRLGECDSLLSALDKEG